MKIIFCFITVVYVFLIGICIGQLFHKYGIHPSFSGKIMKEASNYKNEVHEKIDYTYLHNYIEVSFPNS